MQNIPTHPTAPTPTDPTRAADPRPSEPHPPESDVRRGIAALRPELFARALRLSRSRARADDIVQDTIVRALRFESQFRPGTNLRAWVGQVLMSVFLTDCRRQRRELKALERLYSDPCAWTRSDAPPAMRTLGSSSRRALDELPEVYRSAVELVDLHDLSYREAAERLRVPVGTIMSRLHRGRKMLADALAMAATPRRAEPLAA